jgi:ERCC4-type nuclease
MEINSFTSNFNGVTNSILDISLAFSIIFKQLKVSSENLPLGDIIIEDEKEEKIIIERKTINDLLASIKDGRYDEQSYRLNGLPHHNHNIIYLIEGDINRPISNRFTDRIDKLTIYSAITSINLYKGFSLMRTFNIQESSVFICNMANKIRKNMNDKKDFYFSNDLTNNTKKTNINETEENKNVIKIVTDEEIEKINQIKETINFSEPLDEEKEYINVVKKVKKENITPENIDEIMLSQIPGISTISALAIISYFKNISNLISEIQKDSKTLEKVIYTNSKNQIKKLTKPCINNIIKYLLKM